MSGNEAFVKIVGLCVLGGIANKVLTVISPRAVAAASPVATAVGKAAGDVASKAIKSVPK